jgi:hypothetical protein
VDPRQLNGADFFAALGKARHQASATRPDVKGVVLALVASVALLGLGGCSGSSVQQERAESQFCSTVFAISEPGSSSAAIALSRGTGDNFNDGGLQAAARHFTTAVKASNSQGIANAESQVASACKRLDDWHPPADAP